MTETAKAGAMVHPSEEAGLLCDYRPSGNDDGALAPHCDVFADWLVDGAFASVAVCNRHLPRACRTASQ